MREHIEKKTSSGTKWVVGCGCGCLTLLIVIGIVTFFAVKFFMNKIDDMALEFQEQGFETVVKGQTIKVTDDIQEQTLYMGQMIDIYGHCYTNMAIIAQMAELNGIVDGNVYFRGQMLTIQPNAIIHGDLDITAQTLQCDGVVDGEIKGKYQAITHQQ